MRAGLAVPIELIGRSCCGVSLSGAYDFSDFTPDPGLDAFINKAINYVGVSQFETAALRAASPAYLVDSSTAPLFLVNSAHDSMPFSQLADMTAALDSLGVTNYQSMSLPGNAHAFANWPEIKNQAIAFLAAGLAGELPPPLPSPTPGSTPDPSGSPTPPPTMAPSKMLLNVSTRVQVQSGTAVMIGGFVIAGDVPKQVVLRGIGPSLADAGVANALTDPVLELYDSTGTLVAQNDNYSSLPDDRIPAGFEPSSSRESLISVTLTEGSYTGVLRGANGATGIALFELYDLDPASSRIINISTRGEFNAENDAMIGGFIIGGDEPAKLIVRAIGPSLAASKISNPLADPLLELYDSNGSLISANDNWRSTQAAQIIDSGVAPAEDREAAIVATLNPGGYTAIVRDAGEATGIALVEVYNLESN